MMNDSIVLYRCTGCGRVETDPHRQYGSGPRGPRCEAADGLDPEDSRGYHTYQGVEYVPACSATETKGSPDG